MRQRPFLALLALLSAGCSGGNQVLRPAGEGARGIAGVWWLMLWLAVAVVAIVFVALAVALTRRPRDESEPSERRDRRLIVLGGIVLPLLVLVPVAASTIRASQPVDTEESPLEIRVTGNQWWWEVVYLEAGAVTANEIHLPVDTPVRLTLTSADVIHSFWVPELHGKMDLIPGQMNRLDLRVDEPGVYLGQCAEYCGMQHALMRLRVQAHPPDEFETWLGDQASPMQTPTEDLARDGLEIFEASCEACHTIRGSELARGGVGPDLTHVASRETLAAGALANTRAGLARWLLDPQGIKPGNRMPNVGLDEEELEALLAFLESLE